MTGPSQAFEIGQEVEITGPTRNGANMCCGRKITIEELNVTKDATYYSDRRLPWYPASSLRLVPTFKKGDRVRVIEQSFYGDKTEIGIDFEITTIYDPRTIRTEVTYGAAGIRGMYPASSLRLVEEELKIGDWVAITGTTVLGKNYPEDVSPFQIEYINADGTCTRGIYGCYMPSSLRKLTSEEVAKHTSKNIGEFTATLKLDTSEFEAGIDKVMDKLWKSQVEQRLAAIEKRQDKIDHWMDRFAKVGARWETEKADLEKRLAFLEASRNKMEERQREMGAWIDETNSRMCRAVIRGQ